MPKNNHYTVLSENLGCDDGMKETYQRPFWRRIHRLILLVWKVEFNMILK